jgi:hypothetical protein
MTKGVRGPHARFSNVSVREETRWKFDEWNKYLEKLWDRRVTHDETMDFLLDSLGPPGPSTDVETRMVD